MYKVEKQAWTLEMCVAMVDLNDSESVRCLFRWSLHLQRLTYHKLLCSHGEGLHVQTSWHQVHASKEKPETSIQMFLKQTNLEKPMHKTYPGVHAIGLDFQRHLLTTSPSYNRTNSELYHLPLQHCMVGYVRMDVLGTVGNPYSSAACLPFTVCSC